MSPETEITYPTYEVKTKLKPGPLDGLSGELILQHWKLYTGYVTNVNLMRQTIWDCLEQDNDPYDARMADVQRRLGFEYNGMILHELYFEALQKGPPNPSP